MDRARVLKKLVDNTGLSVKAFSEKAGLPYTTLRSILERGVGNTSVDNIMKICRTLGITVEELEVMADKDSDQPTTFAASRTDGYDNDLPPEAIEELEQYKEFLKMKYKKGR